MLTQFQVFIFVLVLKFIFSHSNSTKDESEDTISLIANIVGWLIATIILWLCCGWIVDPLNLILFKGE